MRGGVDRQQSIFVAFDLEQRISQDHPLRPIKRWCDQILTTMGRDCNFELHDLVRKFFGWLVAEGGIEGLISDDRFSVDGSLSRSMAGHKSIKPMNHDENDGDDLNSRGRFKGKKRSNATHRSVVDPEAHLRHSMHLLTDAQSGLCVGLIEPVIGWCKHTGGLERTRFIGHGRIQNDGLLVASAWNLMRMVTLRGVM
ncbi:MAG: hypothetical protein Q9O74_09350 [Planctomycetota bacterium]|nr:hypothetical protein [Planctomycetota bacterium]